MAPKPVVVEDFQRYLSDPDVAVAVAVIKALTGVILRSEASTMMQMESELQEAAHHLRTYEEAATSSALANRYQNSIATTAGCQLFLRYVTRCFLEFDVRSLGSGPGGYDRHLMILAHYVGLRPLQVAADRPRQALRRDVAVQSQAHR